MCSDAVDETQEALANVGVYDLSTRTIDCDKALEQFLATLSGFGSGTAAERDLGFLSLRQLTLHLIG